MVLSLNLPKYLQEIQSYLAENFDRWLKEPQWEPKPHLKLMPVSISPIPAHGSPQEQLEQMTMFDAKRINSGRIAALLVSTMSGKRLTHTQAKEIVHILTCMNDQCKAFAIQLRHGER